MEVELTGSQRERVLAMRTERLRLVDSQAADARRYFPIFVGVSLVSAVLGVSGAAVGGTYWVLGLIGLLFAVIPGWIAWVLWDDIHYGPARARAEVDEVSADLTGGRAEVESFVVHEPWAFYELPTRPTESRGPLVAIGLPDEERLFFLEEPEIPGEVRVFTLPRSRWRWVEAMGGPVKPVARRVLDPDPRPAQAMMRLAWEDGEPVLDMASVVD
ncbi:MAG: hypothetical protein EP330_24560 [Deltaproteobacteria bacterium]|nr:MAG: hypothetical protein EP330_24560 [Deltaproteobacteria bacterium]